MSTRPGSIFDAMAFTSLGPDELDEPELPEPVLPEPPEEPPLKGEFPNGFALELPPLPEPLPECVGAWNELPDENAERFEPPLPPQAAWPMPTPAAISRAAAPPIRTPVRSLWLP